MKHCFFNKLSSDKVYDHFKFFLHWVWLQTHLLTVVPPSPTCLSLSVGLPLSLTSQVCIYSQQMGSPMTGFFSGSLAHCRPLKWTRSNSLFTLSLLIWPAISLWLHPLFMCSAPPHTCSHAHTVKRRCCWTCPPCSGVHRWEYHPWRSTHVN